MFDMCRGAGKTGVSGPPYGTDDAWKAVSGWPWIQEYLQFGFNCLLRHAAGPCAADNGYTVEMNSEAVERLETKIAFLESANVELSDVVYRQSQEIQSLRARIDALAQRVEAAQIPETVRTAEEERPPHY
jgi:SlyX protein